MQLNLACINRGLGGSPTSEPCILWCECSCNQEDSLYITDGCLLANNFVIFFSMQRLECQMYFFAGEMITWCEGWSSPCFGNRQISHGQWVLLWKTVNSGSFHLMYLMISLSVISFFHQLKLFLIDFKHFALIGDWNAILDPKMDRRKGSCRWHGVWALIDLTTDYDFIDWYWGDHSG